MRALITNDDGIEADGLAALTKLAGSYFDDIWVVAPMTQMSEIGHRVTTQGTIRYEGRGEQRFAVGGTPADCARVALAHLMPEKPDWILSGINHGGNLGRHDFVISGTVAAVREAAFAGVRGVAFSHF
ncbi:MAG: 5'/3'-nucleotidase SurE, partial [Verrucomicrobiota bacterium]